ncbi:hypothetical protein C3B61_10035 [Cryobacterium zongtaii]|uniref:Uncharacterized protein n=1 Tax=Cryobacterium zongtaii TaxID=1259217 RepID=A0A2S3ZFM6_9MICO|nr:hypothetical protein C3B61_10035 [Cryobacterium zongtaii]
MSTAATPRQIFDLVDSLLSDTWPVLELDAIALLERHSCDVLLAHRHTERAVRVARWHCPELDIWGAWTTCPPHGIGLSVYLSDTTATGPTISLGYGALTNEFTTHLGAPEIIDRNPYSPRTSWTRHKLAVSVDSYTREHECPLIKLTIQPLTTVIRHHVTTTNQTA